MKVSILPPLAVLSALVAAGPLPADRVVFLNGQSIEGKVVGEDGQTVAVEGPHGRQEFPRSIIRSVEKEPEPPRPAARKDRPEPPFGRAVAGANVPAGGERTWPEAPPGGKREELRAILAKLEAIAPSIEVWETEEPHAAVESDPTPWKVLVRGGGLRLVEAEPASPAGIEMLWVLETVPAPAPGLPERRLWRRQWWHSGAGRWLPIDRRLSDFNWEKAQIREMLAIAEGTSPSLQGEISIISGSLERLRGLPDDLGVRLEEIRDLTRRAGEPWGGGEILYRLHELGLMLQWIGDPVRKVEIARERRALARELVRRFR